MNPVSNKQANLKGISLPVVESHSRSSRYTTYGCLLQITLPRQGTSRGHLIVISAGIHNHRRTNLSEPIGAKHRLAYSWPCPLTEQGLH